MSVHRGAEILFNMAASTVSKQQPNAISNPNVKVGPEQPGLQAVQQAAGTDSITSAYNVGISYGTTVTTTYTVASTASNHSYAADGNGNIISYP